MTTEKQAVVEEVNEGATPPAETESAREVPLDELLSQFQTATEKPAVSPTETKVDKPQDQSVPVWAQPLIAKAEQETYDEAIKDIFGEDTNVSRRQAKGWIEQFLKEQTPENKVKIVHAFDNKKSNPKAWAAIAKGMFAEYESERPKPIDAEATVDRAAVAAAVRVQSTKAPANEPAPRLGGMSQAEFYKYTRENFGF